jgi:ABC-type transport system involved in multi-copper enzyme maturation permease subunit
MRNILNVALYESRTLFRSWFFRIFSLLAMLILLGINIGMFGESNASWTARAIAANMPYINVLMMNVAQAVIAVFLASDFLRRDKKLDTTEVIYARPITNGEYVVGKTLGILFLFVGLVLLALAMSLVFNLAIKDVPVVWEAYLYYPLLIALPTLIFILGLSFFLMILFRSQAVTFLILLGYIGLTLAYLQGKAYGILDYMAFNLPMVYSDFIGFADPGMILLHRLAYLLMGIGFIFATIRFMNRLPQTGHWNMVNLLAFALFLLAGGTLGVRYYVSHHQLSSLRKEYLAVNNSYSRRDVVDVISNDIHLVKEGRTMVVHSSIRFRNQNQGSLDTLVFSLNPGFVIDSITDRNGPVEVHRNLQLLLLVPTRELAPGQGSRLSFHYHGTPVGSVADLDIPEEQFSKIKRIEVAVLDKQPGMVDEDYLLLTPELLWYPTAGVGFNQVNFLSSELDFVRYTLAVESDKGLVAVAPGKEETGGGLTRFIPENDLNALALVIAPLEKRSLEVGGVSYNLFVKPGHDYFSGTFTHITDTLGTLIEEAKNDYELDELDLYLEFPRINLVEVPIQFHAYERPFTQTTDYILPEMILIPEKGAGLSTLDFNRFKNAAERRDRERESSRTPRELETDMVKRLLQSTFFSTGTRLGGRGFGGFGQEGGELLITFSLGADYTTNPFCVFPFYYNDVTGIASREYPLFNAMLEVYLKTGFEVSPRQGFSGGITDHERANMALQKRSMLELFAAGEYELTAPLISQTGSFIISALKNRVGMGDFDNFLYYYLEDHAFRAIPFDDFERDFRSEFGVEIRPYLEIISGAGQMATFLIEEPEFIQTRDDLGDVFLVRFRITNKGTAKGMVDLTFRIMGSGGFGGGGGMSTEQRLYEVDAGTTKEVQVVLYERPMMMTVNTLISGNIPSSFNYFLRGAAEQKVNDISEYERVSETPVSLVFRGEYVVDNEDEGFTFTAASRESKLKKYIDSRKQPAAEISYGTLNSYLNPSRWHPFAHSACYGESVRSALASRKGDGSNRATWSTVLPETGFYDVYVYIPLSAMLSRPQGPSRSGGNQGTGTGAEPGQGNRGFGPRFADNGTDYHYTLVSSEGSEEVTYLLKDIEEGWNKLGSFHFPSDTVTITLTNRTGGSRVIADAVKWVRIPE